MKLFLRSNASYDEGTAEDLPYSGSQPRVGLPCDGVQHAAEAASVLEDPGPFSCLAHLFPTHYIDHQDNDGVFSVVPRWFELAFELR